MVDGSDEFGDVVSGSVSELRGEGMFLRTMVYQVSQHPSARYGVFHGH